MGSLSVHFGESLKTGDGRDLGVEVTLHLYYRRLGSNSRSAHVNKPATRCSISDSSWVGDLEARASAPFQGTAEFACEARRGGGTCRRSVGSWIAWVSTSSGELWLCNPCEVLRQRANAGNGGRLSGQSLSSEAPCMFPCPVLSRRHRIPKH